MANGGRVVQRRRGTTADHATMTGAPGELTVDTTKQTVVVHDGLTSGGFPLAREGVIPTGGVSSDTIDHIEVMTQVQYDAIADPDPFTLYVIVAPGLRIRTAHYTLTGYPFAF